MSEREELLRAILGTKTSENIRYKVRLATKRSKRSEQFAEVSKRNVEIVDELIEVAEKLANAGKGAEATRVIKTIKSLLENNHKMQQVVGETLLDIPS